MPFVIDPSGYEIRMLKRAAAWRGARVLEVGSGEGRLNLRLASLGPGRTDAFDPDLARVRVARRNLPAGFHDLIHYSVGQAGRIKHPDGVFDIAIFSWAL